jgi:hypothetical protein
MTPTVQVGTILIEKESPRMVEAFTLESEPYLENWSVVKPLDGLTLDDKVLPLNPLLLVKWTGDDVCALSAVPQSLCLRVLAGPLPGKTSQRRQDVVL